MFECLATSQNIACQTFFACDRRRMFLMTFFKTYLSNSACQAMFCHWSNIACRVNLNCGTHNVWSFGHVTKRCFFKHISLVTSMQCFWSFSKHYLSKSACQAMFTTGQTFLVKQISIVWQTMFDCLATSQNVVSSKTYFACDNHTMFSKFFKKGANRILLVKQCLPLVKHCL